MSTTKCSWNCDTVSLLASVKTSLTYKIIPLPLDIFAFSKFDTLLNPLIVNSSSCTCINSVRLERFCEFLRHGLNKSSLKHVMKLPVSCYFLLVSINTIYQCCYEGSYGAGKSGKSREFETGFFRAGNSLDIGCFGGLVGK